MLATAWSFPMPAGVFPAPFRPGLLFGLVDDGLQLLVGQLVLFLIASVLVGRVRDNGPEVSEPLKDVVQLLSYWSLDVAQNGWWPFLVRSVRVIQAV